MTTMTNKLILTATGALAHEHRGIERVVRAIATVGGDIEDGRFVEPTMLADVAAFLRAFALQCQKAKEETMLYPLLRAKCMPGPAYLLASLAAEHRKAGSLCSDFVKNAAIYNSSGGARKSPLAETLSDLLTLYRRQLWKEENIVYPWPRRSCHERNWMLFIESSGMSVRQLHWTNVQAGIERQSRHQPSHLGEILI